MEATKKIISWFLLVVASLIIIGLIFIYSASSVFALEKCGSAQYFVKKQLLGLLLGCIGLVVCQAIPLAWYKKTAPFAFLAALGLTSLTLIPQLTVKIHGSSRWLSVGFFSFQPSEFLKIAVILYLAYLLEKKRFQLSSLMQGYIPFLIVVGLSSGIFLLQPDFGQAVTVTTTALSMFFIVHTNMRHLLYTLIPLIPVGVLLILLKPYRFQRIITFLDPWKDPQGTGFQIIQSLIAIGSGGLSGVGVAQSRQKFFYLPMQHTDFIFSIIAEETGFIGASGIITLYLLLLYLGIRLAWNMKNIFCMLTVMGYTILISLQAVINLFVATGLLPTKGIGLPFISYGNSALIAHLCMVGIIMACIEGDE